MTKIQGLWEAYRWWNSRALIDDVAALFGYAVWVKAAAVALAYAIGPEVMWFPLLVAAAFWARRKARR